MSTVYDDSMILAEDAALKSLLQGITVRDFQGPNRLVQVYYGFPDVEVRQQNYPYIVIELLDIVPSTERQQAGMMLDNTYRETLSPNPNAYYEYYAPVSYDLYYQISTYTRNPMHDRQLVFTLLSSKFPGKFGYLTVANHNGTITARHMFLDEFAKRDSVEEGRRLLRNVFTVRVMSEMTPVDALNAIQQVETVNLRPLSVPIEGQQSVY